MFSAIFKFFTGRSIQHKTDFLKLNALSPIIVVANSSSLNQGHTETYVEDNHLTPAIVCREAILNKSQKVAGSSFTLT